MHTTAAVVDASFNVTRSSYSESYDTLFLTLVQLVVSYQVRVLKMRAKRTGYYSNNSQ